MIVLLLLYLVVFFFSLLANSVSSALGGSDLDVYDYDYDIYD